MMNNNSTMAMNGGVPNPQMPGGGNLPMMGGNGMNMEQMVLGMLQQYSGNNPFLANILNLAQNNQVKEIEQVVRNYCSQNGANFDQLFPQFMNSLGNGGMQQILGMFGGMFR